jgi:putative tricarboxylic transport membrane protein
VDARGKESQHSGQVRKDSLERINGLVVLCIGILILWQGKGLSFGSPHAPGAGFFPALIGVILIVLALVLIVRGDKGTEGGGRLSASSITRVLGVFAALLAYFLLLEYLGFVVVSFLLMAFFFLWVARQRWYVALSSAVLCIGLAYVLFDVLLKSSLPKGVFGF